MPAKTPPLRVLLAETTRNGTAVAPLVQDLGYEVVTSEPAEPDLVIVGPGPAAQELAAIKRLRARADCPVIALLSEPDEDLIREAANVGVAAYIVGGDPESWPPMLESVLRPFTERHDLEAALRRRAVIERAKGILMERHGVRESQAFDLLRSEARSTNHRVVDVASAVLEGHRLLPPDHAGDEGGSA
jgi:response regulator NasT